MEVPVADNQLVGIEYPGTVVNVKNMLQKFGGEKQISSIMSDPTKRLGLSFRPSDPFSKPAYGDRFTTTGIVIEVIRRRKKKKTADDVPTDTYEVKFLGSLNTMYRFKSMCDFQLLPVHHGEEGRKESLLPKLVPKDLYPSSWLEEEVPLFVTPLLYSRFDIPQNVYIEGPPKNPRKPVDGKDNSGLISSSRRSRPGFAVFATLDKPEVCSGPKEGALKELALYSGQMDVKDKLDEFFRERPVWTKNALLDKLNTTDRQRLRLALTCTAYYFSSGPWRTLWVKFGYDPRKDPKSKIYQVMDFRINSAISLPSYSSRSRAYDYYTLPMKALKSQRGQSRTASINTNHFLSLSQGTETEEPTGSSQSDSEPPNYLLISGRVPVTRQCYFQLCDIYIDKVQKLIHQNDGRERFCNDKDGWCDIGVLDKCREIIAQEIKEASQKSSCRTED